MSSQLERLGVALANRYALERELGQGGMAVVYLARDLKHDRAVALKVLRPDVASALGAERFLREIQIVAHLHHPHILQLYDSGEVGGFLYYVMPYVAGESLRDRISREGRLAPAEAARILQDVVDALGYAHAQGVVHRDIKPENILFAGRHALVTDFGVAKAVSSSTTAASLTSTGVAIGTPIYMAPEQAAGLGAIDHRADLYAAGVVGYEMLAGRPPFGGLNAQEVLAAHVTRSPEPLEHVRPETPQALAHAVMRCLEKRPGDRWQSAQELLPVLEALATPTSGVQPTSARLSAFGFSRRQRRAFGWTLLGLGVTAAAAVGVRRWARATGEGPPVVHRQVTFVGNVAESAVSPDGQFVAYIAKAEEQWVTRVHDLLGGHGVEIASDSGPVGELSWSPDGSRIVMSSYLAGGSVTVYPRLGGTPRRLGGGWNHYWTRDGAQTYVATQNWRGISFLTLASGKRTYVALRNLVGWLSAVAQRPDGRVFAALAVDPESRRSKIWAAVIDSSGRYGGGQVPASGAPPLPDYIRALSGEDTETSWPRQQWLLLEDSVPFNSLVWSPRGDILYYLREESGGTWGLWKLNITAQGEAAGRPVPLISGLDVYKGTPGGIAGFGAFMSLTADGNTLYYTKGRDFSNLWLATEGTGPGLRQLTFGTTVHASPSVSPDGQSIAYVAGPSAVRGNVFVMATDGGAARQLTYSDSAFGTPAWSPDGMLIAFGLRQRNANRIAVVPTNEPGRVRVFPQTRLDSWIEWGPGSRILYYRSDNEDVHFLDPQSEAEEPLLSVDSARTGWVQALRYSPGATRVVFAWNRVGAAEDGVYLLSLADGTSRRLLGGMRNTYPLGWSRDGRFAYVLSPGGNEVWEISVTDGRRRVRLTLPFRADPTASTFHGEWFVFAVYGIQADVWAIDNFDPERTRSRYD